MANTLEQVTDELQAAREKQAALIAKLRAHGDDLRAHGVLALAIFGSRARLDSRPDSDLDVLLDYDPQMPFTLYDLVRVERLLEHITGLDVHVTTRDGFRPKRLTRILKDAVSVL